MASNIEINPFHVMDAFTPERCLKLVRKTHFFLSAYLERSAMAIARQERAEFGNTHMADLFTRVLKFSSQSVLLERVVSQIRTGR